jgi:hypothetical protein
MNDVLFQNVELVDVSKLNPYDKNPRKGNIKAIADSLAINKQYRPIVVQKKGHKILAGNHTWQAAKSLGWGQIAAVVVDVDDEAAKRIVLADNRTSDVAEYDNDVLAELLQELDDVSGTGYTETDMQELLLAMDQTMQDATLAANEVGEDALLDNDPLVDRPANEDVMGEVPEEQDIEDRTEDDLGGVYTLKPDIFFDGGSYWEIPKLREDMLITDLPEPLTTWAGSATRDLGWEGYWLYNWGIDSTSGMTDLSKIFLSFYAWDEYFDCWWDNPERYLSKVINAKIKYAITPNYTQGGMPKALALHNLYRSRWVGRYLQEVGCKVMPDLEMVDDPEFYDAALSSLPDHLPWASIQVQNLQSATRTEGASRKDDPDLRKQWIEGVKEVCNRVDIDNLLVYCHSRRWDEVRDWLSDVDVHLEFFKTRLELLSAKVKSNATKEDRL